MTVNRDQRSLLPLHERPVRREYRSPELWIFGRVAALTQSTATNCSADGSTCTPPPSNMGMAPSDRAAKESIVRIGDHPLGIGIYLFDYRPSLRDAWGHGRQFGVMADEVEEVLPDAVYMRPDGYKGVDYAMLGIARYTRR